MKAPRTFEDAESELRVAGLALPEVTEDFPWGHRALKVRGKAFIFIVLEHGTLRLSVKLPESSGIALSMPFVAPTAYGLGRSGWVTATFDSASKIPMTLLASWLEESYRAVAPRRLSRTLPPSTVALEAHLRKPSRASRRPSTATRKGSSQV